jgi:hypothetical protein
MTRDEYEERKRRIEAQHRAGIELLEAACRQQLRALDLVWMTTAEGDVAFPAMPLEPLASLPDPEPSSPTPPVSPAPPQAKRPANRPQRRAAWQLIEDVEKALADVPEVFDRNDICDALGYDPDRGSLYRILQELIGDGILALENRGAGKQPSRYRRLATDDSAAST